MQGWKFIFTVFFLSSWNTPENLKAPIYYDFEIVPFYNEPDHKGPSYNGVTFSIAQESQKIWRKQWKY